MCVQIVFQAFGMSHAPTLHQDQHYLQTDRTKHRLEPLHLGVPTSASKMVSQTMVHQVQTVHLSCTKTNIVSKQTESEIPYGTRHQGVPSGASKLISKHMVCSMQIMHLPCIRISTISKLTEPSFHLSLFIQEYQILRPKWFLRLWCIRRKLCTYLALKLTMSTNEPKQDSI